MAPTGLLDLPLELFRDVIAECVRARSIKRAFRLRLVSRQFSVEVPRVIHEYRLLDHNLELELGDETCHFGIDYVVRRLLKPALPVDGQYAGIRRIAARIAAEDGEEGPGYEHYVKLLVTRKARYWVHWTIGDICLNRPPDEDKDEDEDDVDYPYTSAQEEFDLMAAAAYTNKMNLVSTLMANKSNLTTSTGTFGNAFELAAAGGHVALLDMLLGSLSKWNIVSTKYSLLRNVSEEAPLPLLERCMPEFNAKLIQQSPRNLTDVLLPALITPRVENFDLILRTLQKWLPEYKIMPELARALDRACIDPWEDMARHLVGIGAPFQGDYSWCRRYFYPLKSACHSGSIAIVQLLLDHGADVQGTEIEEAAGRGHWDIVWLLVAHGADINGAVCGAVEKERGAILNELVKRGANLQGEVGAKALELAKTEGLESMATLLQELGWAKEVEKV